MPPITSKYSNQLRRELAELDKVPQEYLTTLGWIRAILHNIKRKPDLRTILVDLIRIQYQLENTPLIIYKGDYI